MRESSIHFLHDQNKLLHKEKNKINFLKKKFKTKKNILEKELIHEILVYGQLFHLMIWYIINIFK